MPWVICWVAGMDPLWSLTLGLNNIVPCRMVSMETRSTGTWIAPLPLFSLTFSLSHTLHRLLNESHLELLAFQVRAWSKTRAPFSPHTSLTFPYQLFHMPHTLLIPHSTLFSSPTPHSFSSLTPHSFSSLTLHSFSSLPPHSFSSSLLSPSHSSLLTPSHSSLHTPSHPSLHTLSSPTPHSSHPSLLTSLPPHSSHLPSSLLLIPHSSSLTPHIPHSTLLLILTPHSSHLSLLTLIPHSTLLSSLTPHPSHPPLLTPHPSLHTLLTPHPSLLTPLIPHPSLTPTILLHLYIPHCFTQRAIKEFVLTVDDAFAKQFEEFNVGFEGR